MLGRLFQPFIDESPISVMARVSGDTSLKSTGMLGHGQRSKELARLEKEMMRC